MPADTSSNRTQDSSMWLIEKRGSSDIVVFGDDGGCRPATIMELELQRRIDRMADFIEERIQGSEVFRRFGTVVT